MSRLWLIKPVTYIHQPDLNDPYTERPRVITVQAGWLDEAFLRELAGDEFVDDCWRTGLLVDIKPEVRDAL